MTLTMTKPQNTLELAALVRNGIQMDTSLGAIEREKKATVEAARIIGAYLDIQLRECTIDELSWAAEQTRVAILKHVAITESALAEARKEWEPAPVQPAGETNDRS